MIFLLSGVLYLVTLLIYRLNAFLFKRVATTQYISLAYICGRPEPCYNTFHTNYETDLISFISRQEGHDEIND
jgi:hypothetical protein